MSRLAGAPLFRNSARLFGAMLPEAFVHGSSATIYGSSATICPRNVALPLAPALTLCALTMFLCGPKAHLEQIE
jgi:hypothetical protein